ncbi:MAG TPA: phosphatase [Oscillospiraceae bacterium]|nr:phosphatase [Oscillospiraceae bacterium]
MTEEALQMRRAYQKQYRAEHKEKLKQQHEAYWERKAQKEAEKNK